MIVLFYTLAAILCLGAHEFYEDTRKQDVCLVAFSFFSIFVVLGVKPPDITDATAVFFNGCATFLFSAVLMLRRAHYLLLTVCVFLLCAQPFGYLIAIKAISVEGAVYNGIVLTLYSLFVGLLLALSDAGIDRITLARVQIRDAILFRRDSRKVGD